MLHNDSEIEDDDRSVNSIFCERINETANKYTFYFRDAAFNEGEDLNSLLHLLRTASKNDKFDIYICCGGGSLPVAYQVCNAIRESKAEVTTIADSWVTSAAVLVFMSGDMRVIYDTSQFMLHGPMMPSEAMSKMADLRYRAQFTYTVDKELFLKIISPLYSCEEIENAFTNGTEVWIGSKEAYNRLKKSNVIFKKRLM